MNLDKIRDYKRMSEKQKAAMPPHLRKPGDDRQDAEEGPIEASVTDRSKHKAAKHVARRKAPVIEMPAPAHEMVTIEVGDAVEVDGFPYANDSADVIQFVVNRDGDGAFAGVSFVGEHKANKTNDPKDVKGEYKENINTPYASSNESLADKSSTPHVEVSEIGITISSDNSSSVAERFETFKTLLQRSLEVDQFKFGLEGAQFLSGERRTEELWTIGLEDEATVEFVRGLNLPRPVGVELRFVSLKEPEAVEEPLGTFEQELKALVAPIEDKLHGRPSKSFFRGLAAQRRASEDRPLLEFIKGKLSSPHIKGKSSLSWGLFSEFIEEYRLKKMAKAAPWLTRYASSRDHRTC